MVNVLPQWESEDNQGSVLQVAGTVGLLAITIPAAPANPISQCAITCKIDQLRTNRLLVFIDGGSAPITLRPGGSLSWDVKGFPTTIKIQGNAAGVEYEAIFNLEP